MGRTHSLGTSRGSTSQLPGPKPQSTPTQSRDASSFRILATHGFVQSPFEPLDHPSDNFLAAKTSARKALATTTPSPVPTPSGVLSSPLSTPVYRSAAAHMVASIWLSKHTSGPIPSLNMSNDLVSNHRALTFIWPPTNPVVHSLQLC